MNLNTEQVLRQLEDTCGCTYAARTAAEAMRGLVAEHQELATALQVLLRAVEAVDAVADYGTELAPAVYQASKILKKVGAV